MFRRSKLDEIIRAGMQAASERSAELGTELDSIKKVTSTTTNTDNASSTLDGLALSKSTWSTKIFYWLNK